MPKQCAIRSLTVEELDGYDLHDDMNFALAADSENQDMDPGPMLNVVGKHRFQIEQNLSP